MTPDLDEIIRRAAPLIDARVALTGRDRAEYEHYLTRPTRPGQTWEDALHARLSSLAAGPLPAHVAAELRRMVTAAERRATAA